MQEAFIAVSILLLISYLFIGIIIGWLAKEHFKKKTHPEMFDENGNLLPDEILAVRFEKGYDNYYETEEDDDE